METVSREFSGAQITACEKSELILSVLDRTVENRLNPGAVYTGRE